MKEYLAIFSVVGLTIGIVVFTGIFVHGMGMSYQNYRGWLSILLSFISLISNAAMSYYFAKKHHHCGPQELHPCSQDDGNAEFHFFGFFPT